MRLFTDNKIPSINYKILSMIHYQANELMLNEEIRLSYNKLKYNFKNKIILDIGADHKHSPKFFYNKKAKIIYAFTLETPTYFNNKIKWFNKYDQSIKLEPEPDFIKIDCEGCEYDINLNKLLKNKSWCIGFHYFPQYDNQYRKMLLTYINNDNSNILYQIGNEIMLTNVPFKR